MPKPLPPLIWRHWLLIAVAIWIGIAPATGTAGFASSELKISQYSARAPTLRVYLYANADPVGIFDPSGKFGIGELMLVESVIGTIAGMAVPSISTAGPTGFVVDGINYYSEWPIGSQGRINIGRAITIAHSMLRNAIKDLSSIYQSATASAAYQYYFGNYDAVRVNKVKTNFEAIRAKLDCGKLTFRSLTKGSPEYDPGRSGSNRVVAWVRGSEPNMVNLQPLFWASESEESAATFIHEISHLVANTDDALGYDERLLHRHAKFSPANAIRTASNYERYAMKFYP